MSEEDVVMMCAGKAARYLCSASEECADHMDCRMSQGRYVCACVDGYVAKVSGDCGKNYLSCSHFVNVYTYAFTAF